MIDVSFVGAFIAGFLSFVSPCVLPLVPPYLCYVAGLTYEELETANPAVQRRIALSSVFFVFGFSVVFVGLGAIATAFGQFVSQYAEYLTYLAGVLIIIFGCHFLGIVRIPFLFRSAQMSVESRGGFVGAFVLGLAFAFGWTPCVGPVLAAVLFVAGGEDTVIRGMGLLSAYAFGIGIPFILAAAFASRFLLFSASFRRHMPKVEKASGVLLVLTGILFITGGIYEIGFWLQETVPWFSTVG